MNENQMIVVTHGGAGSKNEYADGTLIAAERGMDSLRVGESVLDSVCFAVEVLENDSRYNAGIGSAKRSDGSVLMDAACMDCDNWFGAIAGMEGFKNPVWVARKVCEKEFRLLAGDGAGQFANEHGFEPFNKEDHRPADSGTSDTVGAVAFDGEKFSASLSTGGTGKSHPGRIGDVPLIGCGLYAGPYGAVAATGHGESIAMNITAYRSYEMLKRGTEPQIVLKTILGWFDDDTDIGLILVSRKGYAGGSNQTMAWSVATGEK
jgi:L-asparaginase / beta-aspartyl-peptidase